MLGTDSGWLITAASGNGHLAGRVDLDGWLRPWIKAPDRDPVVVPHYAYHNHDVRSINDLGVAAGHAQTDHGIHPLTWAPA